MVPELLNRLRAIGVPTLGHLLEDGFVDTDIRSLLTQVKFVGPALTVRVVGADASITNDALARLQPGDVLVVDMCADRSHASIGAVTVAAAKAAGAAGIIVDGMVTDIVELRAERLPIFARGTSALTTKPARHSGSELQVTVQCGGVAVGPGDLVTADDNGVLIIPRSQLAAIHSTLAKAEAIERLEPGILARIRAGEPASQVLATLPQELIAIATMSPELR